MSNIIADGILGVTVVGLMIWRVVIPAACVLGIIAVILKYQEVR